MTERQMRPLVVAWLEFHGYTVRHERMLCGGYSDLIGISWKPRNGRRIPEIAELAVVELKVRDVSGVIAQLQNARLYAHTAWAAMPRDIVDAMRPQTLARFAEKGIGLLAVNDAVAILEHPVRREVQIPDHIRRRMWRGPSKRQLAAHPQKERC